MAGLEGKIVRFHQSAQQQDTTSVVGRSNRRAKIVKPLKRRGWAVATIRTPVLFNSRSNVPLRAVGRADIPLCCVCADRENMIRRRQKVNGVKKQAICFVILLEIRIGKLSERFFQPKLLKRILSRRPIFGILHRLISTSTVLCPFCRGSIRGFHTTMH